MTRLAVVCPYPVGVAPSQRLKYEQYFDSWKRAGYEIEVFPFWDEAGWEILYSRGAILEKCAALLRGLHRRRRELERVCDADMVYLHIEAVPVGPAWFERELVASGTPFIYDIDDLVHLPHGSPANPFMRLLRGSRKIPWLAAEAAHVIVCTEYLHDFASRHSEHVTDISSTIDLELYRPRGARREGPIVVGWSGSHSTSRYLHLLDSVLSELVRSEGIAVRVIGDETFAIEGLQVEASPWCRASEVEDLSRIDIGVYPLPDEEWVLGKSGLKALQYMALGIPTIATAVGSNLRIIEHGTNGLLASDETAWREHLRLLVRDADLRERLGAAGRETVAERYSVEANEELYLSVLSDVAASI